VASGKELGRLNRQPDAKRDPYARTAFALSPDGKALAAGGPGGDVVLWDVASGKERQCLEAVATAVHAIAFSPDGRTLAWARGAEEGARPAVRLWDLARDRELRRLPAGDATRQLVFSPDGRRLLTVGGSLEGFIGARLWEAATGRELCRIEATLTEPITGLAFSPDGKTLAGGDGVAVRLWRVPDGKELSAPGHTRPVFQVLFSPDGKLLATGSLDGTVRLWDVGSGKQALRLPTAYVYFPVVTDDLDAFLFTPDGKGLVCRSPKRHLSLRSVVTGEALQDFDPFRPGRANAARGVAAAAGLSSGPPVLTGAVAAVAASAEARKCGMYYLVVLFELGDRPLAFSADSKVLRTQSRWFTRSWEVATGNEAGRTPLAMVTGKEGDEMAVRIGPTADGRLIATLTGERQVRLWSVPTGKQLRQFTPKGEAVRGGAFSPDGGTLALWLDPAAKEDKGRPKKGEKAPGGPDADAGEAFFSKGFPAAVVQAVERLEGKRRPGREGRTLLGLWDAADGKERRQLGEVEEEVVAAAFSPDGRLLASLGEGTVRLWDARSGKQLYRAPAALRRATSMAFSPDGALLATGWDDGTALLWRVAEPNGAAE
jgi:WD40 repeat protein